MKNPETVILKIEEQAASERLLGNHTAADAASAKAKRLRLKYNLPVLAPVKAVEIEADQRRAVGKKWEAMKPATRVVIRVCEPGLARPVDRLTDMKTALPLLKAEKALLVRIVGGSNEVLYVQAPDGHQPLPAPPTNEYLAQLRERAKSGPVEQPQEKKSWLPFWL